MNLPAAYGQLLAMGFVFIAVHCIGMCGPIVVGLHVGGPSRVLAYQGGKALTYAMLGALAGLIGHGVDDAVAQGGAFVTLALGAIIITSAIPRRQKRDSELVSLGRSPARRALWMRALDAVRLKLLPLTAGSELLPRVLLGAVLGFLPCMITLWALALAASTRSVVHGAGVMLLLVVMTSPLLVGLGAASRLLPRVPPRVARIVQRVTLFISGTIMSLASLAELGVVAHQHLAFTLGNKTYMLMFW